MTQFKHFCTLSHELSMPSASPISPIKVAVLIVARSCADEQHHLATHFVHGLEDYQYKSSSVCNIALTCHCAVESHLYQAMAPRLTADPLIAPKVYSQPAPLVVCLSSPLFLAGYYAASMFYPTAPPVSTSTARTSTTPTFTSPTCKTMSQRSQQPSYLVCCKVK